MSATPPPPPFIPAPPLATGRRVQREALREQRRAASLAARHQRSLYAAQVRLTRRKSLLGPLFLVTLGSLFLLGEVGTIQWGAVVGWFARWWPLILVGSGLVLLTEWALDLWMADGRATPLPRRTLGSGAFLLLLLVTALGIGSSSINNSQGWLPRTWNPTAVDSWGLNHLFAHHSETVLELNEPIQAGGLLEIRNQRGNITITGESQDGRVHVSAHQRLWAWQDRDLHRLQERARPTLESNGDGLVLRVNGMGRDEADLTIDVPHETPLRITSETGQIAVSEVRAPLTIQDHSGDVVLTAVTGHMTVNERDDNATVSGHSLSGDLTIEGRTGDLAFSDVSGPLTLHGDFFGTTHLERVKGPVRFQSSYTTFTCAGIPGELRVEGRTELQGTSVVGPVTLFTTGRNVTLEDVRGGATITNRNAKVDLALVTPLGPVTVTTTNGPIHLEVPGTSAFRVDASTTNGQAAADEFGLHPGQSESGATLQGEVRTGGPLLKLQTTDGDVDIRKSHSEISPPRPTRRKSPDEDDET